MSFHVQRGGSRLQPPSRPSSAWQRPSSAPAGPRTNATNGVSVSWRGRRYRVRQSLGRPRGDGMGRMKKGEAKIEFAIN